MMLSRRLRSCLYSLFFLLSFLFEGCADRSAAVGFLEVNRDLPSLSSGELSLGITLNPGTTTGRDLLGGNLLVNGSFDLAPRLAVSLHVTGDTTVTTPNGYRQFYPLPEVAYGWKLSDPAKMAVVEEKKGVGKEVADQSSSHHLRSGNLRGDTLRLLYTLRSFAVRPGDRFSFSGKVRGRGSTVWVEMAADSIGGKVLSNRLLYSASDEWRTVSGDLSVYTASEKAFLRLTIEDLPQPAIRDSVRRSHGIAVVDLDDLRLSRPDTTSLSRLLSALSPDFLRYPDGLTSGGFYPGTYPLHDTPDNEHAPLWTSTGYEFTGDFTLEDFLRLSRETGARPILVENAGITNEDAGRRYEDIALVPDRAKYYETVLRRAGTDSMLLQMGYDMPANDYPRRFSEVAEIFRADTVEAHLISGGLLVPEDGTAYSDYVADFALPPLSSPSFVRHIPARFRSSFSGPQPIMLGEVHFRDNPREGRFLPAFLLRAAFLIEAERLSDALRGVSLYPLLSEEREEYPVLLVRDNSYLPTPLYHFCRAFLSNRGTLIRQMDYAGLEKNGVIASLTSDRSEKEYFLKVANTTRHPLTYILRVQGTNREPVNEAVVTRFSAGRLPLRRKPDPFAEFRQTADTLSLGLHGSAQVTIGAYEALIIHIR